MSTKLDFNNLTFDELDQQVMEKLVFDDNENSPILKGHLFVEKVLETLISKNLSKPKSFFKSRRTFELKIDLAKAMGLIDEKYESAFKALNRIRNNYAHKGDYHVTVEELNSFKFEWEDIQNQAFDRACTKGAGEAAKIATIFLCWKAIHLISAPQA
ncbi:hypothetical protein ACFL5L_04455 [candidate division KSB1 bacterium]